MEYELGIIGGMGPLATDIFFKYIIENTPALKDQEHINTIILNHSNLPDRTGAILSGDYNKFLSMIKEDFKLLNLLNLKAIAIPCNTAHYFYNEYLKYTPIKIVNMVEETVKLCKKRGYKNLTIFATEGTHRSGIYKKYTDTYNIELVDQSDEDKRLIMDIIYGIKSGKRDGYEINYLIDKYLNYGGVVLACTELSTININSDKAVDALKVLGDKCISICRS